MILGDTMNVEDIEVEKELKIVFMGTPECSAVVTQQDREKDRHGNILMPPVKTLALEHEILVLQPEKIKRDYEELLALEPDIIITCAYGQMIPKEILDFPKFGCINVHASL